MAEPENAINCMASSKPNVLTCREHNTRAGRVPTVGESQPVKRAPVWLTKGEARRAGCNPRVGGMRRPLSRASTSPTTLNRLAAQLFRHGTQSHRSDRTEAHESCGSVEIAHHRNRCRTIKNSQTVTMTAMAASGYIIQSVENNSAEMVVIAFAVSV